MKQSSAAGNFQAFLLGSGFWYGFGDMGTRELDEWALFGSYHEWHLIDFHGGLIGGDGLPCV